MGLNETPSANRLHIGIFGRRNAGKSSVINAVTGQDFAIVSEVKGTTTDPVYKSMELLPIGPVVVIDTPGIDDEGVLGELRVKKARQVLNKTDVAVLVLDASSERTPEDETLIRLFEEKSIPYILAWNKSDLLASPKPETEREIWISARDGVNIHSLKEKLGAFAPKEDPDNRIVGDLLSPSDFVVLVTPIDSAAPKGRLILPQQQAVRDILEADAIAVVAKEFQLKDTLAGLGKKPRMVVTDSQAFQMVAGIVPQDIPLTSFSILFARYKGLLDASVEGAAALNRLRDGDTVLICEGCTHHRQCDDIGTVKLPRWMGEYTGKKLAFEFTSGAGFPDELWKYALIVHCGGCMLNEREVRYRQKCAMDQGVPITNYGIAIAAMKGILRRSISLFPQLLHKLED